MSPKRHNGRKKDQKWLQKGPKCDQKDEKWSQKGPKCHQNGTQKEALGPKRSPKWNGKGAKADCRKCVKSMVFIVREAHWTFLETGSNVFFR